MNLTNTFIYGTNTEGHGMNTDNCNDLGEAIADDWDARVGNDGNDFHRELIRPATLRMLNPQSGERILDVACGNGLFTKYLTERGVI